MKEFLYLVFNKSKHSSKHR